MALNLIPGEIALMHEDDGSVIAITPSVLTALVFIKEHDPDNMQEGLIEDLLAHVMETPKKAYKCLRQHTKQPKRLRYGKPMMEFTVRKQADAARKGDLHKALLLSNTLYGPIKAHFDAKGEFANKTRLL